MRSFTLPPANLSRLLCLLAVCALVLGSLALSASAQAEPPCPGGMRCGSVTVPLDRQNPSAGTIDIHYALVPHTDTARPAVGTIVPSPGGPGQAAIAQAARYTQGLARLRRDRDLLLIDPRGTGQSGALPCPSLATHNPLSIDFTDIAGLCGPRLGSARWPLRLRRGR